MFFNRGSKDDYDAWEKLGNPGWAWDDLLPYFKKVRPQSSFSKVFVLGTDILALLRAKPSRLRQRI
jgi:choline dehydrogenase-like flavoprotein